MAECINGRGENHVVTHGPECFYCGQIPTKPFETMRAALEAIQELHKPVKVLAGWTRCSCNVKDSMGLSVLWPCTTRRLADQGLGGGQDG